MFGNAKPWLVIAVLSLPFLSGCYLFNQKDISIGPESVMKGAHKMPLDRPERNRFRVWVFSYSPREGTQIEGHYKIITIEAL